ncbi:MAG: GDP-L-fucose synthase [Candidatus Hydrogenedentota bacterium]|nr:MAG: GDP-L-fucose synthase [Candidatus Hydrogenedentota bacterium]
MTRSATEEIDLRRSRVLVTGGSGFLGRHVVAELKRRGTAEIVVPRRSEYDLTKARRCSELFDRTRPDLVIHLAAVVGGIGANRAEPGRFCYENLMMGAHVIEESRRFSVRKLLITGTICCYPKIVPLPFREDDLWNGYPEETNAPYGIAKKTLHVLANAYRSQYGLRSIFLMPVNLYGPGDHFEPERSHVIPALIRKIAEAKRNGAREVVAWGSGRPTREFLYVEDCAEGLVTALERYDSPDPVNLGCNREISIRELAEEIAYLIKYEGKIVWDETKPDGQPRRCVDATSARQRFGWTAKTDFREGLRKTIEDYYQRFSGEDRGSGAFQMPNGRAIFEEAE